MPIKISMPALSPTMTHGNLAKWLKKEGDVVKAGEVLAEIETDKAAMEVEAVDEGVLAKILIQAGTENVAVNSVIAVLLEEGEDKAALDGFLDSVVNAEPASSVIASELSERGNPALIANKLDCHVGSKELLAGDAQSETRIFASPLAKRIAKENGVNLNDITGTGPHGRIVKTDVEGYKGGAPIKGHVIRDQQEYRQVPNSTVRKIIAARLLESKQTIPHFYLSIACNVDKLLEIRADINSTVESKDKKLSVNDFIILASARALKDTKEVNASFEQDAIKYYNNIDISIAVATDEGLITPIIKNADQKDIISISSEMKELARKAKDNKLMPEEFQGGGFTISNLGMFDITNFSAIINPPQSCILAVGSSQKIPIVAGEQIKIASIMNITLSCDHRVVDGVVGARFLAAFKGYIEKPVLLLMSS
jgi:pyruvate dehydrogenase E2 component (dihydrolipoamide acetyltransferase)